MPPLIWPMQLAIRQPLMSLMACMATNSLDHRSEQLLHSRPAADCVNPHPAYCPPLRLLLPAEGRLSAPCSLSCFL